MALCLLSGPFGAMTIGADKNVTIPDASGEGSLPWAVANVGVGENVRFLSDVVGQTINLSSDLDVLRSMNFVNSSGGGVTTDLGGNSMAVATGSTISLGSGLTWQTTTTGHAQTIYGTGRFTIDGLSGNISANSTNGDAYVIFNDDGLSITGGLSGNISANSNNDNAYGIFSYNDYSITGGLSGNISVNGAFYGMGLYSFGGPITITDGLSGDISVTTSGILAGIGVFTGNDLIITGGLSGTVTVILPNASAWGLDADGNLNGGDVNTALVITGSVMADGAIGASAIEGDHINLRLDEGGTLSAVSSGGTAYAVNSTGTGDDQIELVAGCIVVGDINLAGGTGDTLTLSGTNGTTTYDGDIANVETIDVTGGTWTLNGNITDNAALTKSSTGTLTLSGTNTYSGGTTINAGTLIASGGSAIGDTGAVVIADVAGTTLRLDANETIGSLAGGGTTGGTVNLQANTLTVGDAGDTTFAGVMSGTGSLTKQGAGTLALSGTNTYSGGTTINGGTLSLGNSNAAGTGDITVLGSTIDYVDGVNIANPVDLQNDATLNVSTGSATQSGIISETAGSWGITKTGAGTLTLSGTNTYTGGTTVSAGTLALSASGSIGVSTGNAIDITGNGVTIDNDGTITGEAYGIYSDTIDDITITNSGTLNATGTAYGILLGGGNNHTVINTGDVVSTGTKAWGIASYAGSNSYITNSGSVTLTPTGSSWNPGLRIAYCDNGALLNSGTVTFDLSGAPSGYTSGMENTGNNGVSLTNAGTITAHASAGSSMEVYGIVADASSNCPISNSGIINVAGTSKTYGMYIKLSDSTISNSGTITLSGTATGGAGIGLQYATNCSVDNSGSITTAADDEHGVRIDNSTDMVIQHSGSITTGGVASHGIAGDSSSILTSEITLQNGSTININGANSSGIYGGGTVTLDAGSTITLAGDNNTGILEMGTGGTFNQSGSIRFSGASGWGDGIVIGDGSTINHAGVTEGKLSGVNGGRAVVMGNAGTETGMTLNVMAGSQFLGDVENEGAADGATVNFGVLSGGAADPTFNESFTNNFDGNTMVANFVAGTTTLDGSTNNFSTSTVSGGTLFVNGQITGNTTITGGTLGGSGQVGNLINNGGTLAPGNSIGTLTVGGNYTHNAGSTLEIEINDAGTTPGVNNDLLVVGGTATIDGGTVRVVAEPGGYVDGTQYTFLQAGTLAGAGFSGVDDNMTFFDVSLGSNTTDWFFTLSRSTAYESVAHTPNQTALARYLDVIEPGATGDLRNIMSALDFLSPSEARNAFDQMTGDIYGTLGNVGVQGTTLVYHTLMNRLRPDLSVCRPACWGYRDDCSQWNSWAIGYGLGGNASGDGNAYGFGYSIGGALVGLDRYLSPDDKVGLFFAYGRTYVGLDGLSASAGVNNCLLGGYLTREVCRDYFTLAGGFGVDSYEVRRDMQFDEISQTANGDHNGWQGAVYLERGRTFCWNEFALQPYGALQYIHVGQNGFTESNAQSLNLQVGNIDTDSFRTLLGLRAMHPLGKPGSQVEVRSLWMHELLDPTVTVFNAEFDGVGAPNFAIAGLDLGRDWAILGTSASWCLRERCRLFANYDVMVNNQQTFHLASGGMEVRW